MKESLESRFTAICRQHAGPASKYPLKAVFWHPFGRNYKRMLLLNRAKGGAYFWLQKSKFDYDVDWTPPGKKTRALFDKGVWSAATLTLFEEAIPLPAGALFAVMHRGQIIELIYTTSVVRLGKREDQRPEFKSYVRRGAEPKASLFADDMPQPDEWWKAIRDRTLVLLTHSNKGKLQRGTIGNSRCILRGEGKNAVIYAPALFWRDYERQPRALRVTNRYALPLSDPWDQGY